MHTSKQVLALQGLECLAAYSYRHNVAKVVYTLLGRSAVLTSTAMSACNPKMTAKTSFRVLDLKRRLACNTVIES